jgi:GNAT superfamily N-acetyltransferase
MAEIEFHILKQEEHDKFQLIANWYYEHWKIPKDKTIEKLRKVTASLTQFHVLMSIANIPIATGGLHDHVSLQDQVPRFKMYKDWLALIYTIPDERGKGYGAQLCSFITSRAKESGIEKIYLFTERAESLYKRLGWETLEKVFAGERDLTVMNLEFLNCL